MTTIIEAKIVATITIKVNFLKDFFKFLEERKALLPWMENMLTFGGVSLETIREKDPSSWIKAAFIWSKSEQGRSYWNDLDEEWFHYLRSIEKETRERARKKYAPNIIVEEKVQFEEEVQSEGEEE